MNACLHEIVFHSPHELETCVLACLKVASPESCLLFFLLFFLSNQTSVPSNDLLLIRMHASLRLSPPKSHTVATLSQNSSWRGGFEDVPPLCVCRFLGWLHNRGEGPSKWNSMNIWLGYHDSHTHTHTHTQPPHPLCPLSDPPEA